MQVIHTSDAWCIRRSAVYAHNGRVAKLRKCTNGWYAFWCPGCAGMHAIPTKPLTATGWDFDGDLESPTFSPSILITGVQSITDDEATRILAGESFEPKPRRCHSFIRAGNIEYCGDCTHALAGRKVPLTEP